MNITSNNGNNITDSNNNGVSTINNADDNNNNSNNCTFIIASFINNMNVNVCEGFDELFGGRERRDSKRAFLQQLMQRLKPRFRRDYAVNDHDITNL